MTTPRTEPTPEDWARLGARIQSERLRRGMSQKALALVASVSTGSIQAAEAGRVPSARWPQSLSAIEVALGWTDGSMRRVLGGDDPVRTPAPDPAAPGGAFRTPPQANPLPDHIREALPVVLRFGPRALASGASREAVRRYDDAVDGLLASLAMPDRSEWPDPAMAGTPQTVALIEELNEIARRIQRVAAEQLGG